MFLKQFKLKPNCRIQKNISGKKLDYGGVIFGDYQSLKESMHEWVGDSMVDISNVDFDRNDYIVAFGSPLKNACYYEHISNPKDDCGYSKFIPITINYESNYTDTIYLYKIEKGKYRNLCP